MQSAEYLNVGRIVGTHGVRGEIRVLLNTDFPERRFAMGAKLTLLHPSISTPQLLTIEKSRPHKNVLLVKFLECSDMDQALKYVGGELAVPRDEVVDDEEGSYYYHEIVGCHVVTTEGKPVGVVSEILRLPANDVWVVRGEGKEILIPFINDVVRQVNLDTRTITIQWLEGMG